MAYLVTASVHASTMSTLQKRNVPLSEITERMGQSSVVYYYRKKKLALRAVSYYLSPGGGGGGGGVSYSHLHIQERFNLR